MRRAKKSSDATIVSPEALHAAMEEVMHREGRNSDQSLKTTEPLLHSYVRDELLRIAGRLTMVGVETGVAHGVAHDVDRTLAVAAQALRNGYGALLDGLLEGPSATDADRKPAADRESGSSLGN